jgi:ribosomal protein L32E
MELLKQKNEKKSKNPKFIRQDAYKRKRIAPVWRKPRGKDNKIGQRMQAREIRNPGLKGRRPERVGPQEALARDIKKDRFQEKTATDRRD